MDRRQQILMDVFKPKVEHCRTFDEDLELAIKAAPSLDKIKTAMDENGKQMCLELLSFVVRNTTGHSIDKDGTVHFKYKGEWLSREELFENFL